MMILTSGPMTYSVMLAKDWVALNADIEDPHARYGAHPMTESGVMVEHEHVIKFIEQEDGSYKMHYAYLDGVDVSDSDIEGVNADCNLSMRCASRIISAETYDTLKLYVRDQCPMDHALEGEAYDAIAPLMQKILDKHINYGSNDNTAH